MSYLYYPLLLKNYNINFNELKDRKCFEMI